MSQAATPKRARLAVPAILSAPNNRRAVLVVSAGLIGGIVGAAYLGALALVRRYLGPLNWSLEAHLIVMVVVGGVVALLVRLLGQPGDVELLVDNIHVGGGEEDVRSLRSLIPVSLLCVGTGGPLGPEAPLVTTTGSLAAWLGHRGGLDADDRRIVSITGMAAGFTVLFGAPLGSALFALEILHRRGLEYYEALIPAAIGSVCGYAISTALTGVGLDPVWHLPTPVAIKPADLGYAVAAGVVGAAIAALFTYLTIAIRRVAVVIPPDLRPVVGGLIFGAMAFATPYALTNGETQIDHLTPIKVAAGTLLLAAVMKLVASGVAMATGWRGGFIIPLFFVGYCLGRAMDGHLPGGNAWVLAAGLMVAVNVGVTKTPLGSTLVVTEMGGTSLLPTTLIAALVSLVLSSQVGLIHTQQRRIDLMTDDAGTEEIVAGDGPPGGDAP